MNSLKKYQGDILCVLLFVLISFVYFSPAVLDGRKLDQHDNAAANGLKVEIDQYRDSHDGETPRWINSLFGGMPTYQIAPSYGSQKGLSFLQDMYHLWLPDYVFYLFISLLGFYILLRVLDMRQWLAALGAIVWAFSTYFLIIIAAGHIWKVWTLAYIPPTIAGMVLCYKRKYLLGLVVTAFFASLQIWSNHVQMSYYFLIPEVLMVLGFLIQSIRESQIKGLRDWAKATGCVAVAALIAVGLNLSNLYHTYEYTKDTMRGKSELKTATVEKRETDGLDRDYITNWSYGIAETWSLLIPNIHGGASVPLSMNEKAMDKAEPRFTQTGIYGAFTQYWGSQPGTSGPVYAGALVCMLFILALFIVPNNNPLKWVLIISTILSILLAWGRNFMPFTDWCIDYVPMYSKFRTVSSALVVAEFTIPLLAMLALKELISTDSKLPTQRKIRMLLYSVAITASICLLFAVAPEAVFDNCVNESDRSAIANYSAQGYFDQYIGNQILVSINNMRQLMLTSDAWRSLIIILIGALLLYLLLKYPKHNLLLGSSIILLCLIDMWPVNKRYLNDSMFEKTADEIQIQKTPAYQQILETSGAGRNYRVMNFAVSTFNDNTTSAFFSSIGGYHAAKMRRYQELIDHHIAPEMSKVYEYLTHPDTIATPDEMFPVINMLNTQWFIMPLQGGEQAPVANPAAYGNAWFVDSVMIVNDANEEIDALGKVSPRHVAVINTKDVDKDIEINKNLIIDVEGTQIEQTSLISDEVRYKTHNTHDGLAVFSEIYYPGWEATIDGKPAEIIRADYVLRAMKIPAGDHEIVMMFHPKSVTTTETLAWISFALLILAAIILVIKEIKLKHKEDTNGEESKS